MAFVAAPTICIVAPDAWCGHGLASWWLISEALDKIDEHSHEK
jgi:hypothetical protein